MRNMANSELRHKGNALSALKKVPSLPFPARIFACPAAQVDHGTRMSAMVAASPAPAVLAAFRRRAIRRAALPARI
jgi:hypothetical protein